jgi:hypothetical protein
MELFIPMTKLIYEESFNNNNNNKNKNISIIIEKKKFIKNKKYKNKKYNKFTKYNKCNYNEQIITYDLSYIVKNFIIFINKYKIILFLIIIFCILQFNKYT